MLETVGYRIKVYMKGWVNQQVSLVSKKLVLTSILKNHRLFSRNKKKNRTKRDSNKLGGYGLWNLAFKEPGGSLPPLHIPAIGPYLQQELSNL